MASRPLRSECSPWVPLWRPEGREAPRAPEGPLHGGDPPAADRALRLHLLDADPADREGHPQHGRRRRQAGLQGAEGRPGPARDDRRAAAERAPREEVDRGLQTARGDARRRRRDAARGPLLRVPRPAHLDRDPPHPRLPRAVLPLLRRPRQLLDGGPRTDHLPRDRLRRDRPRARPGHHDHHLRAHRRGGLCAALRAGDALLHLRPARGVRRGRRRRHRRQRERRHRDQEARD